jgi:hypothetical protein
MDEDKIGFFKTSLKEARTVFDQESRELNELQARVYWLRNDLANLRKTITALAAMCSEEPWSDSLGIKDSCLEVMTIEKTTVSTQDVVKRLEAMGFDLSSQKNPAASVHSVLSRLAADEEIEKRTDDKGGVTWRGPNYDERVDNEFSQSAEISDDDIPF